MGIGAAMAFYEENASWLDSPQDAYDVLYGQEKPKRPSKKKCPICRKKLKSKQGVLSHMQDVHTKSKFKPIIKNTRQNLETRKAKKNEQPTQKRNRQNHSGG